MKLKITAVIVLFALITGCTTLPGGPAYTSSGGRYQFVEIGGEPYFLDQETGAIYSIVKQPDGKFDINQQVGRVGYMNNAF